MAVLKDLYAKKPSFSGPQAPSDIPTDKVISLKDQGLTVNQIYQALQRQGYSTDQISQSMNQSDLKEGVLAERGEKMSNEFEDSQMPPGPAPMGPPQGMPPPGPMPMGPPGQTQDLGGYSGGISEERIHEIAEAIIEEKWTELIENVNRIIDWKDTTESTLNKLSQRVDDLSHGFDRLHEGVLGKISEYDKGIVDIGVEIKALEKVFQKILPGFMENVNELSRITDKMKGKTVKK